MNATVTDFERPFALVTGASSGIGYELARKLAERGYDLIMVAENADKLNDAVTTLSEIDESTQVEAVHADLSQREGVTKVYEAVRALQRPVDLLCANAGVGVYGGFSEETDLEEEIALINLNVTSQVHLIKLISRDMLAGRGGDILITSSVAGVLPGPRMAVYAASKAFLRSFGQAIRNELKDKGVNVTVLMPGPTDTESSNALKCKARSWMNHRSRIPPRSRKLRSRRWVKVTITSCPDSRTNCRSAQRS